AADREVVPAGPDAGAPGVAGGPGGVGRPDGAVHVSRWCAGGCSVGRVPWYATRCATRRGSHTWLRGGPRVSLAADGAVGELDVVGHARRLELGDVVVPLAERPVTDDELRGVLVDDVLQVRLVERGLLLLHLVVRDGGRQRQLLLLVHPVEELDDLVAQHRLVQLLGRAVGQHPDAVVVAEVLAELLGRTGVEAVDVDVVLEDALVALPLERLTLDAPL